ncbi:MAG: hypothetical protein CMI30_11840 [Opitutae bacterium]|nr:hypothetical protein [Opitutae bacterium]
MKPAFCAFSLVVIAVLVAGCGAMRVGGSAACPDCKGEAKRSVCSLCLGEGYRVEKHELSIDRCVTCLGMGRSSPRYRPALGETIDRYASICPSCSGLGGERLINPVRVFCNQCSGQGQGSARLICARCEGSGKWRGIFRRGKNRRGWVPAPSKILRSPNTE